MADRYKIYEQLGSGGMGAVFRAYDNDLRRWVAIKRLTTARENGADETLVSDLRREADALASLRNPNIVTIFDVATDADGLFIVMELLEGEDLADVVARGPLHYDDFKELASQTLEALLAAHQRHILHRDIKPENIKVERLPGGRLQSKLIDFGLARAGLRARKQTEDQSGTVMGSIFYMAPEQLTRQPVDERTDLYALGCVFYEALSGRKAFDGADVSTIIDKHLNDEVVPLHVIAPHVPPWLGAWVQRLKARKPDDRAANAQQAIHEFRSWEKMSAAPAMMPWMPAAYPQAAYPHPGYPGAATTSSVPVPAYYQPQTGQVPPQHYSTGQVPAAQPAYATGQVLPQAARTPSATSTAVPARPAGRPSVPKARALTTGPSGKAAGGPGRLMELLPAHLRKYALAGMGAVVVLILGIMLMGGKKNGAEPAKSAAASPKPATPPPGGVEKIHFQLPTDRQFPPQDNDLVMHLVANLTAVKGTRDASGKPHNANVGEAAEAWHDLAAKGGANVMRSTKAGAAQSPVRVQWSHNYVKASRSAIDFRPRGDVLPSFQLADPGAQASHFPFGSSTPQGPRGVTLCVVFLPVESALPCRVLTLASADGASLALDVSQDRKVVAKFSKDGKVASITSKDIDPLKPVCAQLTWEAGSGLTALRARDASGKTFSAQGTPVSPPSQPLTRLSLGMSEAPAGGKSPESERFSGWISELLLYASVLRADQMQLLEGPNLRDFYFNSVPPLAQRLKTKLPQVGPRSDWKFNPSQNAGEAKNVADGSVSSRWSTKARQNPGQWFQVELPQEQEVAGFALDCQAASGDYPRHFLVETSSDGRAWTQVAEQKASSALIETVFPAPVRARHLRFMIREAVSTNDWAICELVLFKK